MKRIRKPHPHDSIEIALPIDVDAFVTVRRKEHPKSRIHEFAAQSEALQREINITAEQAKVRIKEQGIELDDNATLDQLAEYDTAMAAIAKRVQLNAAEVHDHENMLRSLAASLVSTWRGEAFEKLPSDYNGNFSEDDVASVLFDGDNDLIPRFAYVDDNGIVTSFVHEGDPNFAKLAAADEAAHAAEKKAYAKAKARLEEELEKAKLAAITARLTDVAANDEDAKATLSNRIALGALEAQQHPDVAIAKKTYTDTITAARNKAEASLTKAATACGAIIHPYAGHTLKQCVAKAIVDAATDLEAKYKQSMGFFSRS